MFYPSLSMTSLSIPKFSGSAVTSGPIPNSRAWQEGTCSSLHHLLPLSSHILHSCHVQTTLTWTSVPGQVPPSPPCPCGELLLVLPDPTWGSIGKYSLISLDWMSQSPPVRGYLDNLLPYHLLRCQSSARLQTSWRQVDRTHTYSMAHCTPSAKMFTRTNNWIHDHCYTFYAPITIPPSQWP